MAIESRRDPSNVDGEIVWGDEGPVSERSDTEVYKNPAMTGGVANEKNRALLDRLNATKVPLVIGSGEAAALGKNVVMGAIAKASVDALNRAQQGQGPRQSGQ